VVVNAMEKKKERKRGSRVVDEGVAISNRKLGKTLQRTKSDRSRFCVFLQIWLLYIYNIDA